MTTRFDTHRPAAARREGERGMSLFETAGVIGAAGLALGLLVTAGADLLRETRAEQTQRALEAARTALVDFAAAHGGCLPFAADDEGGLPAAGDTGEQRIGKRAGDLPWAELGLGRGFLDGRGLRLQYYVASQYVDEDGDLADGITCKAQAKGEPWNPHVTYEASASDPVYLTYTDPDTGDLGLYKLLTTLQAGTPPTALSQQGEAVDEGHALPDPLLEVRRGPKVNAADEQADVMSARNVFVVIAPGTQLNAALGRPYVRDANHRGNAAGGAWPYNDDNVDPVTFAATKTRAADDQGAHGDDALLAESFTRFKRDLAARGVRVEPVCDSQC